MLKKSGLRNTGYNLLHIIENRCLLLNSLNTHSNSEDPLPVTMRNSHFPSPVYVFSL